MKITKLLNKNNVLNTIAAFDVGQFPKVHSFTRQYFLSANFSHLFPEFALPYILPYYQHFLLIKTSTYRKRS